MSFNLEYCSFHLFQQKPFDVFFLRLSDDDDVLLILMLIQVNRLYEQETTMFIKVKFHVSYLEAV